jgi:hypothetical protein
VGPGGSPRDPAARLSHGAAPGRAVCRCGTRTAARTAPATSIAAAVARRGRVRAR